MTNMQTNRNLRDEIRDYWSDRAETFDNDPGHRIAEGAEMAAWKELFRRHLGPSEGRRLVDLASGTGEISRLCQGLGFHVTGLDWSEPMLDRARAKLPDVQFLQADAERTMLRSDSADVIVARHLVWTLVNPSAAFKEWHRVLRSGGSLFLVDGDFVSRPWWRRLLPNPKMQETANWVRHKEILSQVYFSDGARAERVAEMLREAGFRTVSIDTGLGQIHRAQAASIGWKKSILRRSEHRYAIHAIK